MQLTHRSCSNCVYWGTIKIPFDKLVKAQCEKSNVLMSGGDGCGQWKKLKFIDMAYVGKTKDYA